MLSALQKPKNRLMWLVGFLLFAFLGVAVMPASAETTSAISQGFKTTESNIVTGAIVGLASGSQSNVELSNAEKSNQMIGVIADRPLISLNTSDKEVQVVINGTTQTLVSNINGDVVTGDKITASPISGIGMKATTSGVVVGTAQEDFSRATASERTINDKQGHAQTVKVVALPVQINVTYYVAPQDKNSFLPPFLQALANAVAGKDVSPVRVLVSMLVLAFGFVSIAVLLYSSIRSSIISIGRNPLSEGAVRKSLFQVAATAIGILLVMLIAIYLVLTT